MLSVELQAGWQAPPYIKHEYTKKFHIHESYDLFAILYLELKKIVLGGFRGVKMKKKVYNTRYSQAVTHPSTNRARRCLTSVIRREPVCSTWYGRRRESNEIYSHIYGLCECVILLSLTICFCNAYNSVLSPFQCIIMSPWLHFPLAVALRTWTMR